MSEETQNQDATLAKSATSQETEIEVTNDEEKDTTGQLVPTDDASIQPTSSSPVPPMMDETNVEVDTSNSTKDSANSVTTLKASDVTNATETQPSRGFAEKPDTSSILHEAPRSSSEQARSRKSSASVAGDSNAEIPSTNEVDLDDSHPGSDDERVTESRSEIQNIMDQFAEKEAGEEITSPQAESGPLLDAPVQHPPRKSSLEPIDRALSTTIHNLEDLQIQSKDATSPTDQEIRPQVPPKASPSLQRSMDRHRTASLDSPLSPSITTLHRPPPPEPEPEPDLPFDFHRFLEQLRHRSADPVAKFLRSFLAEFGKKQWMVHEQVKIISDFLAFISGKMSQCEIWREVSDAEFDNAREGMEKLVMNRLYTQTFSPAIPARQTLPMSRSRKRNAEQSLGPGRKGQHQEDVERDEVLAQKVSIYGWVQEEHLDIQPVGSSGKRFLILAQQELLKIKTYRAPRDKIICVLNCCKVIFGLLKHSKSDSSADSFMPLLIYVILQANPEHMVSNVQYILRFRNQDKLSGEAGYYLSSLSGAVQFIENLDRTTLTITDEEFEKHVEAAVSAIAEKHEVATEADPKQEEPSRGELSEKADSSRPNTALRTPSEGPSSYQQNPISSGDEEDPASLSGMLRTIKRPLSSIGRIFQDDSSSRPPSTPDPGNTPRISPSPARQQSREQISESRGRHYAEEAAARQASAETAEAQRVERAEHANVVETLASMFPGLDREVISDVVREKHGRVALAVDACLALTS